MRGMGKREEGKEGERDGRRGGRERVGRKGQVSFRNLSLILPAVR